MRRIFYALFDMLFGLSTIAAFDCKDCETYRKRFRCLLAETLSLGICPEWVL